MKRDMDLIRTMLMEVESFQHGFVTGNEIKVDGYLEEEIAYHAFLLKEAGLAYAIDVTAHGSLSPEAKITHLTWAGHEFLDSARNQTRWNQAKRLIKDAGGASIQVWITLLINLAKQNLGI